MLNNEQVKVNVEDSDEYRKLTKFLNGTYLLHTYENKQTRPIKVVAKKLHHICKPERIIENLRSKGYELLDAVHILSTRLFMLTSKNDENV